MKERDKAIASYRFVSRITPYLGNYETALRFVETLRADNPKITNAQIFEKATNGKGKPKSVKRKDGKNH